MIQVTDQRYLDQINEPFRGSFSAEVKLFFKGGTRTFTDDDIFTISENETANIVADENPTQSTEITLSNYNHEFDINGTSGYFRDISDGIECQYRFGFHVIDEDGSDDIVWLDWKRRWCSGEASLAEKQITFTVADVFSTNDDDIEGYMSANYGLIVTNVFNKSTYPRQENGTVGVDFDTDLTNTVMYYQPTYTSFNEIIQSVAFASGKQFYIDHKGVVHIDDDRTTPTGVHLGIGDYFEDNEAGKEKKVKRITVSYYVPEDSTVDARPDFVREMNGTGESVTISNDFICSLEDGNRVMSYLVNYYEKRGTFECTFRGDPRLEPLDVITIDILNSDETVQTVTGTIISVENTYDGTFESTIECRYITTDTTDDTASITGAENFVYPLDSNTPSPTSVTLTCTTSINNPTNYVWEYYNMMTSAWTQIGTGNTLTIPYNTEWLSDDVTTTFRCTVDDSVSASVGIKRVYTHATYTYLGIQQTAPSNPATGDYYLAPSGLVYLWNGQAWVTTTRSDLLINAVADGKTLTGIESTPLGQLIASMQGADGQPGADGKPGTDGAPAKSLTLFADTYNFHTDAEGNVKPNQTITLTVQKQNVLDDIVWTDNKGINVPTNTLTYEFKSTIENGGTSQVTLPENLVKDKVMFSDNIEDESFTSGLLVNNATGNTDNYLNGHPLSLSSDTGVIQDVYDEYYTMASEPEYKDVITVFKDDVDLNQTVREGTVVPFIIKGLTYGKRYYIRCNASSEAVCMMWCWLATDSLYTMTRAKQNIAFVKGGFIIDGDAVLQQYPSSMYTKEDDVSNFTLNELVVINITDNMPTFAQLGLTTEDEIREYLNTVPYDKFGTTEEGAEQGTNPALDGTPTIFTITAGDLSSSVQIGYVQDGNQGEVGNSIDHIDTFYLATSQGSGVTIETEGWTKEPQTITPEKKYLWIYQDIYYTDDSFERTDPYISGVYGDKGDPGEGGTPSMVTLVPSAVTYELSSRNVIQKQQVITVEARVSGGTGTPTWTITPTEADGYTTGKDTNTITITLPVGSSLTGFSVSVNVTGIGEDVIYINGTPVGEPTIRFFEQRASAPTRSDNNGEPFITGDYYVTNDGVPMMYEEISNSWRQPNNGDKYYDQIMTNVGNWWLSKGNDITTTTAALYGYFRTIYSNNAIIDQLSVAGIRLQEDGIIQSTVTLPDGTVRGYEPGDGETYGTTGFYLSADGTAEFYNMSAFGIFAKGSFQADAMVTGEGTSAITQSNLYSQYQSDWVSQESYQLITNTSSYTIGDVYSMNISPDDTYAFWTSVSFSASYKRVYAYAMGIGDTVTSATRLTGIENAIEALSSTNYESVSRSVAVRRNGNGYQAVVAGGVSSNYTQRITVIDTTSASATATTHEYTKTNNPVQFGTIPIFTDTQLLLYNAGSGVDLSSFGNYAEYQIGIADLQSDGGSYSFSWGTSSAQSGEALWGKGTEFEISAIQNNSSIGGVYDAVNGRVWIWLVGDGKMFPTEFTSTNWRQGARYRGNDYNLGEHTIDFNETKTSTYNDYIATDNGMTVITYGNNTAWEVITIGATNKWIMRSIDFGSTRYGFMGWDGTYIYGKNLSTNMMYRGTEPEWDNGNQTSLGYTISSNIVGKYLVDGDILSWSSNVKRTTHGQRMDNIISFFSQLLPKINPSTMSHMPESEPLASVTACTGNVRIAGVNKTIVRMGCSSSTLTIDTNNGSYVYKSGVLYDDTETVEITSLTISAKAASVNTKDILPQSNNTYDIGSSSRIYRTIYCTTLFANQLGSGSDKVYRIYADYIGEQSNKTTTIYTTNLYLGSYRRSTTGYTPLPNGLLLQWGIQNRTGTGTGGVWVNVSFPRSFGTVYGVMANRICNSNSYADSYVGYLNNPATNSGFTYRRRPVDTMYWLAIGSS